MRRCLLVLALAALSSGPLLAQEAILVDAGGHRLEMLVTPGSGPTVVFDGGAVSGVDSWSGIADSVGAHAGTVRYARAGFGGSEVGPAPRTAHRAAAELRTALENAGVELPVVLVSYSLGSLVSMAFADLYPTELAGLVFIDPATDRTYARMLDERPEWLQGLIDDNAESVEDIAPGWRGQMESLPASIDALSEFGPVTGVPSVVITAMTGRGAWPKATEQDMQEWLTDHRALVEQIPGTRHVVLQDATHGSVGGDPAVVREILAVLDAARNAPREHPFDAFVEVGGVTLQYRDWGGEGRLMVLVPSLGMTAHAFETLAPHFTDRHRVLAPTRRGHGASQPAGPDVDLDALANDLRAFIETFSDDPAIVVGLGWATLELATLARNRSDLVEALVFANGLLAPLALPDGVHPPPGQFAPDTVFASLEDAVEAWRPYLEVDRAVLREMLDALLVQREDGMYAFGPPSATAMARFVEMEDWSARLYRGIEAPVLAIQVRQGEYLAADLDARGFHPESIAAAERWATEYDDVRRNRGAELLTSAVPSAEVVTLAGVSHNFVLESPDEVAALIRDFLARIER